MERDEILPFFLVLGTKYGNGEEYRWTLLPVANIPPRNVRLCGDGTLNVEFVQLHFPKQGHTCLSDALIAIAAYEFSTDPEYPFRAESYTLQIEHFPNDPFPK